MTDEVNVISRTQVIIVEPSTQSVSIINAGPSGAGTPGPPGPAGADGAPGVAGPSGPAGAAFLTGSGPPDPNVGVDEQYYLDTVGKVFYGPRSTITAPGEYLKFTDGGFTNVSGTNEYGVRMLCSKAGYITGIRYRRQATAAATLTFNLYNVSPGTAGTLLSTVTDTRASATGYFIVALPTPIAVTAGQVVLASISVAGGGNVPLASAGILSSGTTNTSPSPSNSSYYSHTGPGYPTTLTSGVYVTPIWAASLTTTGLWPAIINVKEGLRVAWENDSTSYGGFSSEISMAQYVLSNPTPGVSPGGMKWIFSLHGLCSNTGAAAINLTLRVKINGTVQLSTSTVSIPNGTGERIFEVIWELMPDNDWSINQKAKFRVSGLISPPNVTDDAVNRIGYTRGTSFISTTWDEPLMCEITGQWSSGATQTLDLHGYDVIFYATTPG